MRTRWLAILAVSAAGVAGALGLVALVALFIGAPVGFFVGVAVVAGAFIGAGGLCVLLELLGTLAEPGPEPQGRRRR